MKLLATIALGFILIFATYCGWVQYLTFQGYKIDEARVDHYTVSLHRYPRAFSLWTPLYGKRYCPGQLIVKVTHYNLETSRLQVDSGDSFYPNSITVASTAENTLRINIEGLIVIYEAGPNSVHWQWHLENDKPEQDHRP